MGFIRGGWVCGAVLVIATLAAKSAPTESSYPAGGPSVGRGPALASAAEFPGGGGKDAGLVLAQMLPFERNKVEPIDVRKAFVEGYEAYQRRDYLAVIGRMQLASASMPDLADYALFYLGAAQRKNGDLSAAADSFRRLIAAYPQSVLSDAAGIAYAKLELRLGHPDYALAEATRVVNSTCDPVAKQNARLVMAQALVGTNDFAGAYRQAQAIREEFPSGPADPEARALAYRILNSHPAVAAHTSVEYHRAEAAILLREGQAALALGQIHAGLRLAPADNMRAELRWLMAEASRGNPAAAKAALLQCLEIAPTGARAPAALDALAQIYWRADDTVSARTYFSRILREFPDARLAPEAMFEIARTYEDDGAFAAARIEYLALIKRYAGSELAADARFRAPFMLYMLRHFGDAAAEFGAERTRAAAGGERDMFAYWEARALERAGEVSEARERFSNVARSVASNYYPALAGMRVNLGPQTFPAASAPEIVETAMPNAEGSAGFHIRRVMALGELGLRGLEPAELRALEPHSAADPALRDFMLREMLAAGAWHDAIQSATMLSERGALNPLVAERFRYPRGYWEMVRSAATRNDLDPYLVAALIRQESLYDPDARSGSDARGLMQLLPSTAEHYAASAGVPASPLDLYDPAMSVRLGTTYLRRLFAMFDGNMFRAVAAYNGGEHAVAGWVAKYPGDDDQWVENIGFRETRDYVKKVIGGMREYRRLYPLVTSPAAVSASAASSSTPPL